MLGGMRMLLAPERTAASTRGSSVRQARGAIVACAMAAASFTLGACAGTHAAAPAPSSPAASPTAAPASPSSPPAASAPAFPLTIPAPRPSPTPIPVVGAIPAGDDSISWALVGDNGTSADVLTSKSASCVVAQAAVITYRGDEATIAIIGPRPTGTVCTMELLIRVVRVPLAPGTHRVAHSPFSS